MATAEGEGTPRHLVTPPGLVLMESGVGDGTKGVFCLTPISEGQMYGPYAGEVILEGHDSKVDYRYAWEVYDPDSNELMHIINATKPETGNWMRYVNCARYFEEQNIVSVQVGSEIFYKAIRHIPAKEELLTWFSLSYQMQKKKKKKRKSVDVPDSKETVSESVSGISGKKKRKTSTMSESGVTADDMKTPLLYEMMTSNSKYGKDKALEEQPQKKQTKLFKSKSTGSIDVSMLKGGVKTPKTPTKKPQTASNTPIKDLVSVPSTPSAGIAKKGNSGTPKKALKVKDLIAMQAAKNKPFAKIEISPPLNKLPIPKLKCVFSTSPKVKGQPKGKADGPMDVACAGMVLHSDYQPGRIYVFELRQEHHVENEQGKKMYTCDICFAPYSHAFSLKRHFLRSHINAKYLPLSDITNCLINVVQQEAAVNNCKNNTVRLNKNLEENMKKGDTKFKTGAIAEVEKCNEGEYEGRREITLPGVFRCYLCAELFDDLDEMKRHTKNHPAPEKSVKKFSCEKCDVKFTHKNNLARHQDIHSDSITVSCPVCGRDFSKESNMKKHLQFHQNRNYTCTECAEQFTMVAELRKHIRMEHPGSESKMAAQLKQMSSGRDKMARLEADVEPVKQLKMDQIKKKKIKMKKKLAAMSPDGKNKQTSDTSALNSDQFDPNKPVPCPICNKRFSTVPSMKKHLQFHGNRRFTCRYCKEKFPHPFGLRKHLWSFHTAQMKQNLSRTTGVMRKVPIFKQKIEKADEKPTLQTDTGKIKEEKLVSAVKVEVKTVSMLSAYPPNYKVSAEKPYSCRVCGKAFPSEANMKMHLQYHFGRTFSCRFCFKKFPHPASLRKHLNADHPEGMVNGVLIKNKPDIIIGPDGKRLKRKRKKKIKTELELMLTHGELELKKEPAEETDVKNEENADKESVKSQERELEEREELEDSEEEDLWEEEIRITRELKKKARLHFSCILCKKKFNSYVNMCRHKRLAHRVKKYGVPTLTRQRIAARMQDTVIVNDYLPITPAEYYANVAENIATNLDQFIDGKREALTHYEKHVKIPDYHSVFEVAPEEKSDIEWSKYNFPKSFTPWEGITSYEIEEDLLSVYDKIGFRDERAARRRLRRSRSSSDASFEIMDDSSNQGTAKTPVKSEPQDETSQESKSVSEKKEDDSKCLSEKKENDLLKMENEASYQQIPKENMKIVKTEKMENVISKIQESSENNRKSGNDNTKSVSDVPIKDTENVLAEESSQESRVEMEVKRASVDAADASIKCVEKEDTSIVSQPYESGNECKCTQEIKCVENRESLKILVCDGSDKSNDHLESVVVKDGQCKTESSDVRKDCDKNENELSQQKPKSKNGDKDVLPNSQTLEKTLLEITDKLQIPVCDSDVDIKESKVSSALTENMENSETDTQKCASLTKLDCDIRECVASMVRHCEQMGRETDTKATDFSQNGTQIDSSEKAELVTESYDMFEMQADCQLQDNSPDSQMDIASHVSVDKGMLMETEDKSSIMNKIREAINSDCAAVVKSGIHTEKAQPSFIKNDEKDTSGERTDSSHSEEHGACESLGTENEQDLPLPGNADSEVSQDMIQSDDIQKKAGDVQSGFNAINLQETKLIFMTSSCQIPAKMADECAGDKEVPKIMINDQMEHNNASSIGVPSLHELALTCKERNSDMSSNVLIQEGSQSGKEVVSVACSNSTNLSESCSESVEIVKENKPVQKHKALLETVPEDVVQNFTNNSEWMKEVILNDIIQKVFEVGNQEYQVVEEPCNSATVRDTKLTENMEITNGTVQGTAFLNDSESDPTQDTLMTQKDCTVDSDIKCVVESILSEVASNNITSDMKQMLEGNNNICSLKSCVEESFRSEDLDKINPANSAPEDVPEKDSIHDIVSGILSNIINGICSLDGKSDCTDEVKFSIRGPCHYDTAKCESSQTCVMETYEHGLRSPTSIFRHLQLKRWNEEVMDNLMVNISHEDETKEEEIPPQGKVIRCKPSLQLSPVPTNNFKAIAFGSNGQVNYVCGVCKKHFLETDALLRHHMKKHPSIDFSFIEIENGNDIDLLFYTWPCNYGLLASSQPFPEDCRNLDVFTCTRCGSTFKHIHRLHVHIINCDPKNYETLASKRRKYRKKMRKQMMEAIKAKKNEQQQQGKTVTASEPPRKPGRPKGVFGTRKKKVMISSDSPSKNRKRRNYELLYNPHNHVRRREMTDVLETHQCHGCENTFKTLSLLERHAKKCSGRDKLQKMKPVQNTLLEEMAQKPRHTCRYCSKHFTYLKSLANHYRAFCPVRKSRQQKGLLSADDFKDEEDLLKLIKRLELAKLESKEVELEEHDGRRKKGGWPRGMKRKNRRKRHCWTYVKKKKPDEKDGAESSLFDPMLWNPEVDWMEQLLLPGQGEEEDSEEEEEDDEAKEVDKKEELKAKVEQKADISPEIKSSSDTKSKEVKKKGNLSKSESNTSDIPESPSKLRKIKNSKKESETSPEIKEVKSTSSAEASSPKKKSRKSVETKSVPEKLETKSVSSPTKQQTKKTKTEEVVRTVELTLEGTGSEGGLQITETEGVCSLNMSDGSSSTPGSSPDKKKRKYVRKIPLEEVLRKKKENKILKMKMYAEALKKQKPLVPAAGEDSVLKTKVKKNLNANVEQVKNSSQVTDVKKKNSNGSEIVKPALAVKTASPKKSTKHKSLLESGTVTLITVFPHNSTSLETSSSSKCQDTSEGDSPKKTKKNEMSATDDPKPSPKKNSKKKQSEKQVSESPKKSALNKTKSPKKVSNEKSPDSQVFQGAEAAASSGVILNESGMKTVSEMKSPKKATLKKQSAVSPSSSVGEAMVKKSLNENKPKTSSPRKKVTKVGSAKKVKALAEGVSPKKSPAKAKTTPKKMTIVSPKSKKGSPKTMSAKQSPVKKAIKASPILTCFERLSDTSSSPDSRKNSPSGKSPAKKRKKNQAVSTLMCDEDPDFLFDSDDCCDVVPRKKPKPQLSVQPLVLPKQVSEIGQESDISR